MRVIVTVKKILTKQKKYHSLPTTLHILETIRSRLTDVLLTRYTNTALPYPYPALELYGLMLPKELVSLSAGAADARFAQQSPPCRLQPGADVAHLALHRTNLEG